MPPCSVHDLESPGAHAFISNTLDAWHAVVWVHKQSTPQEPSFRIGWPDQLHLTPLQAWTWRTMLQLQACKCCLGKALMIPARCLKPYPPCHLQNKAPWHLHSGKPSTPTNLHLLGVSSSSCSSPSRNSRHLGCWIRQQQRLGPHSMEHLPRAG